jgi:4-hydroxybenzoate polyprenyltransferase
MAGALFAALSLPRPFLAASGICAALSVLYSVPPVRLKAVAGFDWLINMAGFGFLTPYAGWALTGREVVGPGLVVLISFAFLFGALYPLTQIYQLEEDTRRGDRTLSVWLGIDRSLGVALVMAALAFIGFAVAGFGSGWRGGDAAARWAALIVAAAAWLVVLIPWWRGRDVMDPPAHQTGMHRALAAWAITDMAVLFAWAR